MRRTFLTTLVVILSAFVITADAYAARNSKAEESHDLAITNISAPSSSVQGDTVSVAVKVANQGNCSESFIVRLIDVTNGKEIGTKSVALSAKDQGEKDADVIFTGETDGKQSFGAWLTVGDVNGDKYDDLLVSATLYNNEQGRVYLYYGGRDMDNKADKVFTGENTGDIFGSGGGYLADMNKDGFDDVIIGARNFSNRGRVYIYWGAPNMDEKADIIIEAEPGVTGSGFGRELAVGDVNGDGYKDLIVSAPLFENNKGRAYLFYGGNPFDTTIDKIFTGENTNDLFSHTVCASADVDGDGCDDLLTGTRFWPKGFESNKTGTGRAYLFYGGPGTTMDEACDLYFDAENPGDEFGSGVDLFDVDKDGYADVIIGARRWNRNQGRVYLYWGSDRTNMDNKPDLYFDGEIDAKAEFSSGSIKGGYANKDKYGDIIVPAFDYYQYSKQGRAYLYYGNTKASMDTICDHTFTPDGTQNMTWIARIGDFNGNGYGDIILGGHRYNNYQGRCWLWYGGFEPSSTDVTFNWDTTRASVGEHTLKAEVSPVAGEEDKADNIKTIMVNVKSKAKEK